jgi:hypothetical protein
VYLPEIGHSQAATPAPTPTPDAVYIASEHGYASDGEYQVVAELVNGRAEAACVVGLDAKFFNAGGAVVETALGWAMLDHLAPGQHSPAAISISTDGHDIAGYALTVARVYPCLGNHGNLTVLDQSLRDAGGAEVYGEVRNDTEETLAFINVVVTFYDERGRIRYAASGGLEGGVELEPGARGVFRVLTGAADLLDKPYTVQAQGSRSVWQRVRARGKP